MQFAEGVVVVAEQFTGPWLQVMFAQGSMIEALVAGQKFGAVQLQAHPGLLVVMDVHEPDCRVQDVVAVE